MSDERPHPTPDSGATSWESIADEIEGSIADASFETHRCPYLPEQQAGATGFVVDSIPPELYHALMNRGFRRSGQVIYRPSCANCRQCVQLRIPVAEFRPSRSQRRVLRRNQDLVVSSGPLEDSAEMRQLLGRYLRQQHPAESHDDSPENSENYVSMLFRSVTQSSQVLYATAAPPQQRGTLLAVSIVDHSRQSLSSVYHFFDPNEADRSLGVYSALWEIEWCRRRQIPHYYLGFWIRDCRKMNYKNNYRPYELLDADGHWHRFDEPDPQWPPGFPPEPANSG